MTMRSELYSAAVQYLSRREYAYQELLVKLGQKYPQANQTDIVQALERLKQADYQSDIRYAEQIIRAKINTHYGWRYIQQYLKQQGVAESDVQSALDEVNPDWYQLAKAAYDKKYRGVEPADFKDAQKRKAFLLNKGFSFDEVNVFLN